MKAAISPNAVQPMKPITMVSPLRKKETDVVEHPEVFDHVGLLVNEPPGFHRSALHLVIRPTVAESNPRSGEFRSSLG